MQPVSESNTFYNAADDFIDRNVREGRGPKTAVICEDRRLSYAQIQQGVNRFGNLLRQLDVRMEERVALLLLDTEVYPQTFFGAIKLGAVPVCLNTMMRPKDYQYFLNDSRARVLVVDAALKHNIDEIAAELPFLKQIIVANGQTTTASELNLAAELERQSSELETAPTSPDDACFWLYSSGTTGQPKGTVHLQRDMIFASETYAQQVLGIKESDVCFSAAKLFFAYGLGNGLYFPFSIGATAVYHPGRPTPEEIFAVIARHQPSLFFGVPTLYAQMLEQEGRLDGVRLGVSAGEALPAAVFRRWHERFGIEIIDGIGSTEMVHIFISNRPGECRPGSTGRMVPGYEARIVDENLHDLPRGEVGTLLVKGGSAAAYYWNKHQKTQSTMLGEWLNTGDKFCCDDKGFFCYSGRSDDMLKIGGIWVSPIEVEASIIEHRSVVECAVVPDIDADKLVKPKAYVVLTQCSTPSETLKQQIQDHVKSNLAHYKYPRWIEFVDALPKTPTGKIKRFELKSQHVADCECGCSS